MLESASRIGRARRSVDDKYIEQHDLGRIPVRGSDEAIDWIERVRHALGGQCLGQQDEFGGVLVGQEDGIVENVEGVCLLDFLGDLLIPAFFLAAELTVNNPAGRGCACHAATTCSSVNAGRRW